MALRAANWESEEYRADALGNNLESRDGQSTTRGVHDPRYWTYTFHGELTGRTTFQPQLATEVFTQGFDGDGNVAQRYLTVQDLYAGYTADDQTRSYYDAANRLRAVEHYNTLPSGDTRGTFDEYAYDALGRRILVLAHRKEAIPVCNPAISPCDVTLCNTVSCNSSLTRTMWDGSATLVEDRVAYGTSSTGPDDGYVTYVQGLEVDRPVGVIDARVSGNLRVPHATWRGEYESSSTASGAGADCSLTTNSCAWVAWSASGAMYNRASPSDVNSTLTYTWVGGLLVDQQDATGLLYRRNRYYDPMSGRFTQEDPIGLAGGLNVYGFAGGDPVNHADPLGLLGCDRDHPEDCSAGDVWHNFLQGMGDAFRPGYGSDTGPGWMTGMFVGLLSQAFGAPAPVGARIGSAAAVAEASADADATVSTATQRAIRSLQKQLDAHVEKLEAYKANPDAFDNQGILKNASPEIRQRIIEGRVRHLENEIQNFRSQIAAIRNRNMI